LYNGIGTERALAEDLEGTLKLAEIKTTRWSAGINSDIETQTVEPMVDVQLNELRNADF
jgi:hypothetical protein